MDIYLNALSVLKEMFRQSGKRGWEEWIQQDIEEWKNNQSTTHHKSAYGGMGSLNDLILTERSSAGCWQNILFDNIKGICYEFSMFKSVNIQEHFSKTVSCKLSGSVCRNCGYGEIAALDLEVWLAEKFIPAFIAELIPSDAYLKLAQVQNLMTSAQVTDLRNRIEATLPSMKIAFDKQGLARMRSCINCRKEDIMVYRWEVIENKQGLSIKPANDSIKLKT